MCTSGKVFLGAKKVRKHEIKICGKEIFDCAQLFFDLINIQMLFSFFELPLTAQNFLPNTISKSLNLSQPKHHSKNAQQDIFLHNKSKSKKSILMHIQKYFFALNSLKVFSNTQTASQKKQLQFESVR